jgi:hypothetical protein
MPGGRHAPVWRVAASAYCMAHTQIGLVKEFSCIIATPPKCLLEESLCRSRLILLLTRT